MPAVLGLNELRQLGWGPALVPIAPGSKRPGVNGADALGWQSKTWTPTALAAAEKRGCSFGVRLNVAALPAAALDCDAENGTADAAPVVADVARRVIGEGARRGREGTARFVLAYRTAAIGDGKRVAQFQRGADSFGVELFDGSGQVLFGPRHSSGAPYLWDSAPDNAQLPVVTIDAGALFAELAKALKPLGYALAGTAHYGAADALERDAAKRSADPLWRALVAKRAVLFEQRDGRAAIRCPFESGHTSGKGKRSRRDSSTSYLPPLAEGGNGTGFISCLHASCAARSQAEYAAALGVELPPDPIIEFPIQLPPIPGIPASYSVGTYEEAAPPAVIRRPLPMAPEAFRGPLGAAATLFAESCEASQENLLAHLLVTFSAIPDRVGVEIGRAYPAGCALQALIVGPTAIARKGTALSFALRLLAEAFPVFVRGHPAAADALTVPAPSRLLRGLSSGEGLVFTIRDARQNGKELDPGTPDKRLLVLLEEFSALLKVANREGNTLSELFRQVHDGGALAVPTRHNPLYAMRSHVAAIAHCTPVELTRRLDAAELVNGMLNRWLIFYVERVREDAAPPSVDALRLAPLADELRARLTPHAFTPGSEWCIAPLPLTLEAAALWRDKLYRTLNANSAAGIAGGLNVRFAAYAKRLALLYAITEGAQAIGTEHLGAAVAVLAYCEDSMSYLFGNETYADPFTQRVADLIREGQGALVPRVILWKSLGHHIKASALDAAIGKLHEAGAIRVLRGPSGPNGVRPWAYAWRVGK